VRSLPAIAVLVLLAATALAFVHTQQQKLERSPIGTLDIDKEPFSPICRCPNATKPIGIRFRRGDTITLELQDGDGNAVRTLADALRVDAGMHRWTWDGLDDEGELVPDGVYEPRLTLRSAARTFVMKNPITVDTTPPAVTSTVVAPRRFSPDGDGRRDLVDVRYTLDEPAFTLLRVDGRQIERTHRRRDQGVRRWNGRIDGRAQPPGRYAITLAAEDLAGNVGAPSRPAAVEIRYVELGRALVRTKARARFGIRVLTDARTVKWRFARASGSAKPGLLVLRAPRKAGRYTLFVTANGHGARAVVVVRPRPAPAPARRSGS
jgi:hypothetical protein